MKITAIKQQVKHADRVSIFVDGTYAFSLTLDQLLQEKIKKDIEIDEVRLKQLKKLSDEGKLKARTLEWLLRRPHSVKECRDYLYKKKAEKELILAWVEEFSEKNYLNDESFARWFAEGRIQKNKSSREINAELRAKGIPPVTIQSIVTELGIQNNDKEALTSLINKLRDKPRYADEQKLIRYLLSKGFTYTDIKEQLH